MRQWAPFGFQVFHDLLAGPEDDQGSGVSACLQIVVRRVKVCGIALKPDVAQDKKGPRVNPDRYRNGYRTVERGVGRQVLDCPAIDRHRDYAAIARVFIKRGNQPVAIVAGLDDKPQLPGNRKFCFVQEKRAVFERLCKILVRAVCIERDAIADWIDDLDRSLFFAEQRYSEELEGMSLAEKAGT